MFKHLKTLLRVAATPLVRPREGEQGIRRQGHRGYVGGMWEEIGRLQFDFLRARGLTPDSYLLDIACGSLRLGVKAIPYLKAGHYLGIEKEPGLVEAGLRQELGRALEQQKRPRIVISDRFEFEKLGQPADIAIAQSLFTHLPPALIHQCLAALRPWLQPDGVLFATYFEAEREVANPDRPHDHGYFAYTRPEMEAFGQQNGYLSRYIGDWNHPRQQVMVEYRKNAA